MAQQIWRRVSKATGRVSYQVKIEIGKKRNGKPKYISKTFARKKDAEVFRRKVLGERQQGLAAQPTKMTVGEYLEKWMETVARPRLRPVSYDSYEGILNLYIYPDLADRLLKGINGLTLQNHYSVLLSKNLSPRTIRYAHSIINSAFSQAVKWRLIPRNPCAEVELPRQQRKEMTALNPEETITFLEAARKDRLGTLFELAVTTGMRPGEYLGLKWDDVDFEAGTVTVQRTLVTRFGKEWYFSEPKTARSRRTIPLPKGTVVSLRKHKIRQFEERLVMGALWINHDLVFANTNGRPLDRNNLVKRNFLNILKAANIGEWEKVEGRKTKRFKPKIRLYDLRHTCATLLLAAGENPKVVSERLGHASIVMTLDTYSHVLPGMQEAAAERLDTMLYSSR